MTIIWVLFKILCLMAAFEFGRWFQRHRPQKFADIRVSCPECYPRIDVISMSCPRHGIERQLY